VKNIFTTDEKEEKIALRLFDKLYQYAVFMILTSAFIIINLRMYFPVTNINFNVLYGFRPFGIVLFIVFDLVILYKFVLLKLDDSQNIAISLILIICLFILLVLTLINFRVTPSWDFGDVLNGAKNIADKKPLAYREYFEMYPHNLNPAVLIGLFLRYTGNTYWSPYIMNAIHIMATVIITYLLSIKILGTKLSTIVTIIILFCTPVYLYSPIVYTDTLSMPYPVLTIYFWVVAKSSKTQSLPKYLFLYALIGIFSAFGYLYKPVAAIGLIAAAFETILRGKTFVFQGSKQNLGLFIANRITPVATSILMFILVLNIFNTYASNSGYSNNIHTEKTFPYTHWLMLGSNKPFNEGGTSYGYGGFSHEDMFYTKSLETYKEKEAETTRIFLQRVRDMGVSGYLEFLGKKLEYVWNDGTYYVLVKLTREPLNTDPNKITGGEGASNTLYLIIAQLAHSTVLLLMLVVFISSLRGRCNQVSRMMGSMCLGIMVFLLLWEARSRYIVTLIPIFAVLAGGGIGLLESFNLKKRKVKDKKKILRSGSE